MRLSILICTLENRRDKFGKLFSHLLSQIDNANQVEVLSSCDSGELSTGEKRNLLLMQARGEYICFVDDDDWVPDDYVKNILEATDSGLDCVNIKAILLTDGKMKAFWNLGWNNEMKTERDGNVCTYIRPANHLNPIKRYLALQAMFPGKTFAEDKEYSKRVQPLITSSTDIETLMYEYRYSTIKEKLPNKYHVT